MTRVVNLHREPYDVYIGRPGRGLDGRFGNPVRRGLPCPVCEGVHTDNGSTLQCYARYLYTRLDSDPSFRAEVLSLVGKRLGCFCKPGPCHGDIIVGWLDGQKAV